MTPLQTTGFWSRRDCLKAMTFGGLAGIPLAFPRNSIQAAESDTALIAITLDLEMSANFPTFETTHWNFEKGNLNDETKRYSVEAARHSQKKCWRRCPFLRCGSSVGACQRGLAG